MKPNLCELLIPPLTERISSDSFPFLGGRLGWGVTCEIHQCGLPHFDSPTLAFTPKLDFTPTLALPLLWEGIKCADRAAICATLHITNFKIIALLIIFIMTIFIKLGAGLLGFISFSTNLHPTAHMQ